MKRLFSMALILGAAQLAVAQDAEVLTQGKAVYDYWCLSCHGAGNQYPGTVALGVKYRGELPAVLEDREDLTPEVVKAFVRTGISVMPFFRKTEISDEELDALAEYLSRSGSSR